MESLNFQQGNIIGKNELIHWNLNLRESLQVIIDKLGDGILGYSKGAIIKDQKILPNDLLVEESSVIDGYNTIKISAGWGMGYTGSATKDSIISSSIATSVNGIPLSLSNMNRYDPFFQESQINIEISGIGGLGDGDFRYVTVHPRITIFERGTCNISASNQVTFSNEGIVAKLRDQSSNSPSKLKFFTDSSTPYNSSAVYEVVSIIDSTKIVISGNFVAPVTGLYCSIVGSYDLQETAGLSSGNQYLYGYIIGDVTIDETTTPSNGGFQVARLEFLNDHTFTIIDIRKDNLFNLSTSAIKTKIIEIPSWNMDANETTSVIYSIPNLKKIRSVSVMVRNDSDHDYYNLSTVNTSTGVSNGGVTKVDTAFGQIDLWRLTGGLFDSSTFDDTTIIRGWVTIQYEV